MFILQYYWPSFVICFILGMYLGGVIVLYWKEKRDNSKNAIN